MGSFNEIKSKYPFICPHCGKKIKTKFQSKDLGIRFEQFKEGERIKYKDGKIVFEATKGNELWKNVCGHCYKCYKQIGADVMVKNGVIGRIKNFRKYNFEE